MTGNTVGIIDLGTNTALLLIGQINPYGKITILNDEYAVVRLGSGVDSTRHISVQAMDRACAQLKLYAKTAQKFGVTNLIAWGTSAVRDAENKDELIKRIYRTSRIHLHVLEALDEAKFTYFGATYGLKLPSRLIVIDIGGGSTEIACGTKSEITHKQSFNIGALRLSEQHKFNDLNDDSQLREIRSKILKSMNSVNPLQKKDSLIAVSGTALTIAALATGCRHIFDPILHGRYIKASFVKHCFEKYSHMTPKQLSNIPAIGPDRSHIIVAGIFILDTFLTHNAFDGYIASMGGVRYGLLEDLIHSA